MPDRCVAANCSNVANPSQRIFVHTIPFFDDPRPEAVKRRKKWVDFVKMKRAQWEPSKYSAVCSKHFKPDDYVYQYALVLENSKPPVPRLKRDNIGVTAFPTIHAADVDQPSTQSDRTRRKVLREALEESSQSHVNKPDKPIESSEELPPTSPHGSPPHASASDDHNITIPEQIPCEASDVSLEMGTSCTSCSSLKNENRQLRNQVKSLQNRLKERRRDARKNRNQAKIIEKELSIDDQSSESDDSDVPDHDVIESEEETEGGHDTESQTETEYEDETGTTTTDTDTDTEEEAGYSNRISMTGTNLRTEPKHIVFFSQLLLLFNFCHTCKTDHPEVEAKQVGTKAVVTTSCSNPKCPKPVSTWHSQPFMPNSQIPAGNFLLCMAVLLAGSSATKVFQVFKHMGLCCVSLNTYFKYQRSKLFPTISIYWEKYQAKLLAKVKAVSGGVNIAGDGRHDSMGHSAKFGAYTMFCCTIPMIIHFVLVQRNQAGSSPAMEFMGFEKCINFLIGYGIIITSFISDRHLGIAAHMRTVLKGIRHYFDIWHLKKKIRKLLTKISKEKGGEAVSEWIKPCENHLYWSAASTHDGKGNLIWAKFKSFLYHVINKHTKLGEGFDSCKHGVLSPRKWLSAGSIAYEKLVSALTNKSLVKGISKASPFAQTSCLEGFHSLLNQFAPKMIAFSYIGMYCRHILAIVHFNFNLQRDVKKKADGTEQVKVSYPKFKNGEATVRNVRVMQNFDYVEEIFQTYLGATKDDLSDASNKLKEKAPAPMNTMLEKQPKDVAIEKMKKRRSMVVADVPATGPVPEAIPSKSRVSARKGRKKKSADTPAPVPEAIPSTSGVSGRKGRKRKNADTPGLQAIPSTSGRKGRKRKNADTPTSSGIPAKSRKKTTSTTRKKTNKKGQKK